MSEEQLKAFIAKAKDDQSIQEKLKAAKALEDVVVIAKTAGFLISTDELKAQEKLQKRSWKAWLGYRSNRMVHSNVFKSSCWTLWSISGFRYLTST